jgi:hypothetical protein
MNPVTGMHCPSCGEKFGAKEPGGTVFFWPGKERESSCWAMIVGDFRLKLLCPGVNPACTARGLEYDPATDTTTEGPL